MTNTNTTTSRGPGVGQDVWVRLDRALLGLRRATVRPETARLPVPSVGRAVDLATVLACTAVGRSADSLAGAAVDEQTTDASRRTTIKDVASALGLDHSTASRLLSAAEAEGLVRRTTDDVDRRCTTVRLTAAGRRVVDETTEIRTWAIGRLLAEWSDQDAAALADLLELLLATLEARMPLVVEEAQARLSAPLSP